LDDRLPTEQMLHAFEQCADAAAAFVWDRVVAFQREHKLLVLGAESETRLGLAARLEPRDEILARFDRSHVDLVASHAGFRRKGPRPYTAPAREGNWVTPRMQNSGVRLSPIRRSSGKAPPTCEKNETRSRPCRKRDRHPDNAHALVWRAFQLRDRPHHA